MKNHHRLLAQDISQIFHCGCETLNPAAPIWDDWKPSKIMGCLPPINWWVCADKSPAKSTLRDFQGWCQVQGRAHGDPLHPGLAGCQRSPLSTGTGDSSCCCGDASGSPSMGDVSGDRWRMMMMIIIIITILLLLLILLILLYTYHYISFCMMMANDFRG